jgi:Histone acetylation protein 2.
VQLSKVHVTLIGFETLKQPEGVDAFVSARRKSPADILKEVAAAYQPSTLPGPKRETNCPSIRFVPMLMYPNRTSHHH